MRLIAETLGLRCKIQGNVGGYASIVDHDGYPFFEGLDVRD